MMRTQKEAKCTNRKKSSKDETSEETLSDMLGKRSHTETEVDLLDSEESSRLNSNDSP